MRFLFALFIIVPLVEMIILIKVGGVIGALPTIALVCLTAAIGVVLIKAQGRVTLMRAQQDMNAGQVPASALLDGLCLIVGGAMLLTPGFFTDGLGFVLLIPQLRRAVFHRVLARAIKGRAFVGGFGGAGFGHEASGSESIKRQGSSNHIYQGEFERHDDN